jgi:hypothetical protein
MSCIICTSSVGSHEAVCNPSGTLPGLRVGYRCLFPLSVNVNDVHLYILELRWNTANSSVPASNINWPSCCYNLHFHALLETTGFLLKMALRESNSVISVYTHMHTHIHTHIGLIQTRIHTYIRTYIQKSKALSICLQVLIIYKTNSRIIVVTKISTFKSTLLPVAGCYHFCLYLECRHLHRWSNSLLESF